MGLGWARLSTQTTQIVATPGRLVVFTWTHKVYAASWELQRELGHAPVQVTGQSCSRVRVHNWLLSASGVTGHPYHIPICYPDACTQAMGQMESLATSDMSGSEVTRSRPLQSVEVLTTLGSRDPPYNRPAGGHLCRLPGHRWTWCQAALSVGTGVPVQWCALWG